MYTYYMDGIYEEIENAVKKMQRHLRRGVLPKHVQPQLPYARAEGSIRRDMGQMWETGRLMRVGGQGARRGYRLATSEERFAFAWISSLVQRAGTSRKEYLAVQLGMAIEEVVTVCDWLAEIGRLIRMRDGSYRAPSSIERMAYNMGGLWPHGAERSHYAAA